MLAEYIASDKEAKLNEIYLNTRSGIPSAVFGVSEPLRYAIAANIGLPILYLVKDSLSAMRAAEEISAISGKKAVYFPAKDDVLLYKRAVNRELVFARVTALFDLVCGAEILVTTPEALLQLFPKKIKSVRLKKGQEFETDKLLKILTQFGYKRNEFAALKGEMALRGDIFEIFPINSLQPVRLDFFGDEIEKVRLYDGNSRILGKEVDFIEIPMALDFYIEQEEINNLVKAIEKAAGNVKEYGKHIKAKKISDELKERLESGSFFDEALSYLFPLLSCKTNDILSYLPTNTVVIFDEPKLIAERLNGIIKEHTERCLSLASGGEAFDFTMRQMSNDEELFESFKKRAELSLEQIASPVPFFFPIKATRLTCSAVPRYQAKRDSLFDDLKNWKKSGYRAIICCGNSQRADKLAFDAEKEGVYVKETEAPSFEAGIYVTSHYLSRGYILHDTKTAVIGTLDLYLSGVKEKKIVKSQKEAFTAPEVGDYAVHETHGIGKVLGTERISTTESTKDYLAIEYAGGDILYVPMEQLDRLSKYLGGEKEPKLNKIGGVEFDKIKERVKASIAKMAVNLKKIYKERAEKKGFRFSPDNELSEEFAKAFEFDETEDQLRSIAEISQDMESDKIMDRLLCGDVGYGKTEVAFRAAFKAIMDGKQVAFVAPTTILTEQHYNTAVKRFEGFGVRIAVLNRFQSPLKVKDTIKKLATGDIDLLIGTHKTFAKDVIFKDLGLLILDEEQCFGVEHKEKLRAIKTDVDTLTMTATPIPRTLHMSLSGIRDLSLISTPPVKRIPVQAYVLEESDLLIRDAVLREISRRGQVFILYNRVETIAAFSERIKQLIPEASIIAAHGQMAKSELENSVNAFYRNEYNVLISTTIIENGIDIPGANTLIVIDADRLGLFTLYQLKGRVGRSDRMAHAYFTFKPDKILGENAYKRLSALLEHTELGSGFKIAMRDLEIRGAGNVLGREQHGHMDKIGYELYSKLLREQLGEVTKEYETELDVRINAFIPDDYVTESTSRLDIYKTLAELRSEADLLKMTESIVNAYGSLPMEVKNLADIALFKSYCRQVGVIKAVINKKECSLVLNGFETFKDGGLNESLSNYPEATLKYGEKPTISFSNNGKLPIEMLKTASQFLSFSIKK